jgi:DNA-damage-inducible protein D
MEKQLVGKMKLSFDEISHNTDDGVEYWLARELQPLLGYSQWRRFSEAIERAKTSCETSGSNVSDHFADVGKIVTAGVAEKDIGDVMLTRYAFYLIAQNGDPRKDEIAFAQSYFAVQTRKQELIEERLEALNRLQLREQLRTSEKRLSQIIYERGVDDAGFARIRSKGDAALFGGRSTADMKEQYGIKSGALADRLPPVTVAAKNLATEMTNLNVEEKDLRGEPGITDEHVQNNKTVRGMLAERGIKPETLPPAEDIKKLERRVKSEEKTLAVQSGKLPATEE